MKLSCGFREYGVLTVRKLLDMREQCVIDHGFTDPYLMEKREESSEALQDYESRIKLVDGIQDKTQRWEELIMGLLQGNYHSLSCSHLNALKTGVERDGV